MSIDDEEVPKEKIKFDKKINRVIIELSDGKKVEIEPQIIRDVLPILNEGEKIKDLYMMIHDIEMERLTRISLFNKEMLRLEKGIDDARQGLKDCTTAVCVKKYSVLIKSFVDSKNTLAEIRRTITLLEKMKKPLRIRIAQLGHDPDEYI